MKTKTQLEKEIEDLRKKFWWNCDVEFTRKLNNKLITQLKQINEVIRIIREEISSYDKDMDAVAPERRALARLLGKLEGKE